MRPSVQPLKSAVEAYSRAIKPTPELIWKMAAELAEELQRSTGQKVTLTIGTVPIVRQ